METGDIIAASKLMADFIGWKVMQVMLSKVHVLPKNFKHGLVDSDGKIAKYCASDKLRFHESMDWMLLVWDKIEKLKGKGQPFCVHLGDRYWGSWIDYFPDGHYKMPRTIAITVILNKAWNGENKKKKVKSSRDGEIFGFANNKTEAVFISCYEFLKWAKQNKLIA